MSVTLKDGATGNICHVDENNQLHNYGTIISVVQDAVVKGAAYNINTGTIGLTSGTASAVLYFKNDEDPINGEAGILVDTIVIGIDDEGTTTGMSAVTIVRNPTGGTIISGASAVAINQNRNFGSSNALSTTTLAYKGAEGNTLTGGNDYILTYQQPGTRVAYPISTVLPKGSSLGVTIDTDTSSGTTNVYAALVVNRIDGKNA